MLQPVVIVSPYVTSVSFHVRLSQVMFFFSSGKRARMCNMLMTCKICVYMYIYRYTHIYIDMHNIIAA
jgi:hypothetical protein